MLRLLYGPAASGKTDLLMGRIRAAVAARKPGQVLLVPEQYSHEAERALCAACGDSLSLYAEVLSFTGLARRVAAETGAGDAPLLDQGGRLLCMALALDQVAPRLRLFGAAARRAQMQQTLLGAVDELKTACVTPDALEQTAARCPGYLGDKLRDLALVLAAYDAVTAQGHADPTDRLTRLAERIPESALGHTGQFYLDGFTDYTRQELAVVRALLTAGADVTVCLTLDALTDGSEIFGAARRTARVLLDMADDCGVPATVEACPARAADTPLRVLEQQLFSYTSAHFDDPAHTISVRTADDLTAECAWAASRALQLMQSGCRWRDIAIAARGFSDYAPALERMCAYYGVPLYFARRTDLLQKPLVALIRAAYDIVTGGWDAEDVSAYLRTGLAGLTPEETDTLENYVLLWSIRGSAWTRPAPWQQHPDGYGAPDTDESAARLAGINDLRRRAADPLRLLGAESHTAATAEAQAMALADFLERLHLAQRLDALAEDLRREGRGALAAEYAQLWELTVGALEQFAAILGGTQMDADTFATLFLRMLSCYDIGTIPVALDRVTAGDLDRMRRRGIRHLIVLGASDDRLPRAGEPDGVFSPEERRELLELELDIGGGTDDVLWREYNLIYQCVTLPAETLTVTYPLFDGNGTPTRAAFLVTRIGQLFGALPQPVDPDAQRLLAPAPALELAARTLRGATDANANAARAWFGQHDPAALAALTRAAHTARGRLSPERVRALYGQRLYLSASKAERFSACRYAYFLQYGLKARPRRPAAFSPPEIGTFFHYVLQHTAQDATAAGGFAVVTDEELGRFTDHWTQRYIHDELNDFQEKSARFIYLFRRLCRQVRQVVTDMAHELRAGDFVPLDFELNFADPEQIAPITLSDGEVTLNMSGVADRVDGWLHDGKLYLRVVDYKTGRKAFSLSDVWYGMGLQMLLYLFALERSGPERYGHEIVPAGVLYVPARDVLIPADRRLSPEEAAKERAGAVRRSGLLLDDSAVLHAMEHSDTPQYLPLSARHKADALASAEQLGLLARHIETTLLDLAHELRDGSITADPYFRSGQDTACTHCDYLSVCHFTPGVEGDCHRVLTKLPADKIWSSLKGGEPDA